MKSHVVVGVLLLSAMPVLAAGAIKVVSKPEAGLKQFLQDAASELIGHLRGGGPSEKRSDVLALELRNVSKRFGAVVACEHVDLKVGLGEVVALAEQPSPKTSTAVAQTAVAPPASVETKPLVLIWRMTLLPVSAM